MYLQRGEAPSKTQAGRTGTKPIKINCFKLYPTAVGAILARSGLHDFARAELLGYHSSSSLLLQVSSMTHMH